MALLHGLIACGFRHLVVCHLNHGIRGKDAEADADFVRRACEKLEIRCLLGFADVPKQVQETKESLEVEARKARHDFFAQCARAEHCSRIFLGHHQDDQLETILHHFFRGSGRKGLGAMRFKSDLQIGRSHLEVYRPLLTMDRLAIDAWMKQGEFAWREDASNSSGEHTRNRLRQELIPELDRILGRNFRGAIHRLASIFWEEDAFLESLIPLDTSKPILVVKELVALPLPLQRRAVIAWLKAQKFADIGFLQVETVLSLLAPDGIPAKVNLPKKWHARRRAGHIFLEKID